jgi:predicted kinase
MQTPLLVIKARRTARRQGRSDQVVERLRELGRTVEYIIASRTKVTASPRREPSRARKAAADWLLKYL